MNAQEFAEAVVEIIQSEPEEIVNFIDNEDWDGLRDEVYYTLCAMMEE